MDEIVVKERLQIWEVTLHSLKLGGVTILFNQSQEILNNEYVV